MEKYSLEEIQQLKADLQDAENDFEQLLKTPVTYKNEIAKEKIRIDRLKAEIYKAQENL